MVNTNCAVFGCMISSFKNKDARFHQFPRSQERCKRWLQACQRPDLARKSYESLKYKNICNRHFEKCMYGKRGLKKMAIPTLYLPSATETVYVKHNIEADVYVRSAHSQTDPGTDSTSLKTDNCEPQGRVKPEIAGPSTQFECDVLISCDNSTQTTKPFETNNKRRRKRAFEPETNKFKSIKRDTRKEFIDNCDKFLPPNLSAIAKSQADLKQPAKYTIEFKQLCFDMFMGSPMAYKALSEILDLPSKLTLANIGTETSIWELLEKIIKHMSRSERKCVLCLEAMKLEPELYYDTIEDRIIGLHELDTHPQQQPILAEYALTLMLQGIVWDWKLPIAFTFTANFEFRSIEKWLVGIARNVFNLGFDIRALVSSAQIDFSKPFRITTDNLSFHLDGYEVYYIFDLLDLINTMRDNFIENNFEFEGKTAKWEDIVKMHDLDVKNKSTRLNNSHIKPNRVQKEQIKNAARVFSDAVATGLKEYESSGALKHTHGTVEFIETMSKLLIYLIYYDGVSSDEILDRVLNLLGDLKVKNKIDNNDVTVKFKNDLIITIKSLQCLVKDWEVQHLSIQVHKINNSCLKSFFDLIRRVSGTRKPNCTQYAIAFEKHFLCQILNLCDASNETNDFTETLGKYTKFVKNNPVKERVQKNIQLFTKQYYDVPDKNSFSYVCAYLLRRCAIRHAKCLAFIEASQVSDNQSDLINYIHNLETEFEADFYELVGPEIGQRLFERLSCIEFKNKPCECYPVDFLIKLFIRMRIFHIIQYNNRHCSPRNDGRRYMRVLDL